MGMLLKLMRGINTLNASIGKAVSWLLLLAVLISAGNAMMRKLFSLSSNAWLEAQWYLFSAAFLIAAAYTLLDGEHVKVDLLYTKLPRKTQLWVDILGTLFFLLPFCVIVGSLSWPIAVAKFANGEISNNPGGLVLWPVWALIPFGFGLLGFQGLSEIIKRFAILTGKLPDPVTLGEQGQ